VVRSPARNKPKSQVKRKKCLTLYCPTGVLPISAKVVSVPFPALPPHFKSVVRSNPAANENRVSRVKRKKCLTLYCPTGVLPISAKVMSVPFPALLPHSKSVVRSNPATNRKSRVKRKKCLTLYCPTGVLPTSAKLLSVPFPALQPHYKRVVRSNPATTRNRVSNEKSV
jgi:uncharacterized membrane protein